MASEITRDNRPEKLSVEISMQKDILHENRDENYFVQKQEKNIAAKEIGESVQDRENTFLEDGMEIQLQQAEERAKQSKPEKLTLVDLDVNLDAKALLIEGLVGEIIKEMNKTLNPEEQITSNQQKKIVADINKEYSKVAANKMTNTAPQNNITKSAFQKHALKAYTQYNNAPRYTEKSSQGKRDKVNVVQQKNEPDTQFARIDTLLSRAFTSPRNIMNLDNAGMSYLLTRCGIFNPYRMQPQSVCNRTAEEEVDANDQISRINSFLSSTG